MTKKRKREIVNDIIYRFFLNIADSCDAGELAEMLTDDVLEDVQTSADSTIDGVCWGDVHIGLTRVLKARLGAST